MGIFRILYIDMDSFYDSVEQHLNPELRGRPAGITAVDGDVGAIVAASYYAKRLWGSASERELAMPKESVPASP